MLCVHIGLGRLVFSLPLFFLPMALPAQGKDEDVMMEPIFFLRPPGESGRDDMSLRKSSPPHYP